MAAVLAAALALQATGSIYSAYAQKRQAEEEASDLERSIPELRYRAELNKQETDLEALSIYGQQVTTSAFSGADVSKGSPLMNYAETFSGAAKEKFIIDRETLLQTQGYQAKAAGLRKQARKAMIAGVLGAGGSAASSIYQHQLQTGQINPKG